MKKKKIIIILLCIIIATLFIYMFWPYLHLLFNSEYVTIDNEEYFFYASIICHSEREFKKIPIGTTFAEIEDRFGLKNGWYNHSGAVGSYFYIVAPNKYIIINIKSSDALLEYLASLTNEESRARERELVGMMQVTRIMCANDKEVLWMISGYPEGFLYAFGEKHCLS